MTKRSRKLLVGALAAGLVAAGAGPVTAAADPVHAALRTTVTNGFPGALVQVRDGERPTWRTRTGGTNYLLTGLVVEAGHDFGTELRSRILAPLGLE
ncbi:hypothetical protein [Amycolatopsis sp. 195334CR]|uniref:hypothetical protein n=1 Tax=Amycolatopsis sp. 195334CR TaxID=2814588 RepID=UPI001A8D5831|nr:hypothetical protein [Amycolatopsis sp. 195334CR]MBN6035455.1 hypothetical protein [Amycolatopsis sp. 195334CR]